MATFQEIKLLAGDFLDAFRRGAFQKRCPLDIRDLSLQEAYQVQAYVIASRVEGGDKIAGYKVGCTSPAIRKQLGLKEPISGRLMDPHLHHGDASLSWNSFFNCAVEAEFVFRIGDTITGERLDDKFLLSAIESVAAGIEIHHHRFWYPPPTQQELIASNGIHAGLVIGKERRPPGSANLAKVEAELYLDGVLKARGRGRDVMGGPLASLRWLVEHLRPRGLTLKPGHWVIPGSPAELVEVPAGSRVRVALGPFGSVTTTFTA